MLSTSDRSIENFGRVGVAIKTKQSEYAAGAPADRIQLSVRRDQFVGEQSSRGISVRKQIVPLKQFRRDGEAVNDGTESGRAANAERARHSCCVAAFQILSQIGKPGQRKLGRGAAAGDARVPGEKQRDSRNPVVEIGSEANELKNVGIAKAVESDPRGARTAANCIAGQLFGNLVGFRNEGFCCRLGCGLCYLLPSIRCRSRRLCQRSCILADHLDLPLDFMLIEIAYASARTAKPGFGLGSNGNSIRVPNLISVAWRNEVRDIQRDKR